MARSRNIKPGLFKNEILGIADPLYTLAFQGLWLLADRAGRLEDRPLRIKAETFPYRDGLDIDRILNWLETEGFILRYEANGKRFIQVLKFSKHQSPHKNEVASDIPPPEQSEGVPKKSVLVPNKSEALALIPDSGFLIPEVNPPISPQGGNSSGEDSALQKKVRQPRGKKLTFKEWAETIRSNGEKAISDYNPVWEYADRTGIPREFIEIAWVRFKEKYLGGNNASKTYVDWRAAFRDHVEGNYLGLWHWSEKDNQYRLTTAGMQANKASEVAA